MGCGDIFLIEALKEIRARKDLQEKAENFAYTTFLPYICPIQ
jgi:hypothetical protein